MRSANLLRLSFSAIVIMLVVASVGLSSEDKLHILESWTNIPALLRIGPEPERQVQMTERGYTLIRNINSGKVSGVVVFFQRGRIPVDTAKPLVGSFEHAAFKKNFAIMHVSTGNPLDFFFYDSSMAWAATEIQQVLVTTSMKDVPVFFVGLSLGGTRALKFAQFLERHSSNYWLRAAACVAVDSPLDYIRFHRTKRDAISINFHPTAVDEARWVTYLLEQNLGGSPDKQPARYSRASVYTHSQSNDSTAALLSRIPIRLYHEPDIDWWLKNRGYSMYDLNSIDESALISYLRILGNKQAELVTTWQKREGFPESSPHTWSIVDNDELVVWLEGVVAKE